MGLIVKLMGQRGLIRTNEISERGFLFFFFLKAAAASNGTGSDASQTDE